MKKGFIAHVVTLDSSDIRQAVVSIKSQLALQDLRVKQVVVDLHKTISIIGVCDETMNTSTINEIVTQTLSRQQLPEFSVSSYDAFDAFEILTDLLTSAVSRAPTPLEKSMSVVATRLERLEIDVRQLVE
eukprot:GILJ01014571.1.p1 GENE.GILJ01014571.1~~GILJ01014571.1.p1  ORF type:complete len:130 (-),score=19.49 GILJ01014571.1:160-549(-)